LQTLDALNADRLLLLKRVDDLTRSVNKLNIFASDDDEDAPLLNKTAPDISQTCEHEPTLPTNTTTYEKFSYI
jgi:hypothetical protein